ncbi:hypothetical protein ACGFYU_10310 [Streptomyces sp. NPDC048337]|uniref:hypothetical protein n=1 Tax=Streptomyces sp. NPDC048337 TaxID=3365535 RepID=UPI003714405D
MTAIRQQQRRTKKQTVARTGRLAAVAVAAGLSIGAVTAGSSSPAAASQAGRPAAAGRSGECAEVRDKVERLEGLITPNACAFMKRQIAFGEMPTGTPPVPGGPTHPRVAAYLDIFDADATLWEAGGPAQRGHAVIGASITGSLGLAPDLRYVGTNVVADGAVMMFGQRNEVTVKGQKVTYLQIARNVLSDDGKTIQARRYYDRYEIFRPVAPELRPLFDGIADAGPATGRGPERFRADEITARLAAWNGEDVAALTGRVGNARLTGPGLAAPLATAEGKSAYLKRFFEKADVKFQSGQVAFGGSTTYVEWHGTITSTQGTAIPFGIVERFGPRGEWELSFDTLPLVAEEAGIDIRSLYQRLAQP